MRTRRLGELEVSALGVGATGLVSGRGPAADEGTVVRVLRAAVDRGFTFFDTAPPSSGATEVVGRGLRHVRQRAVIATKVGSAVDPTTGAPTGLSGRPTKIRQMVDVVLTRNDLRQLDAASSHFALPGPRRRPTREPEASG